MQKTVCTRLPNSALWTTDYLIALAVRRRARRDVSNLPVVPLRLRSGHQRMRRLDVAEERRLQTVIILLWNRIELVVVTARALDRESQQASSGRRNEIVQVLVPPFRVVFLTKGHARTGAQESGGNQGLVAFRVELVAGDLLL